MKSRYIALVLVCIIALLAAGCGAKEKIETAKQVAEVVVDQVQEAATEVAVEVEEAQEPTDTPEPAQEAAKPEPTVEPKQESEAPGETEAGIPDVKSYDDLKSYRQEIKSSNTVDGEIESEFSILAEFDKDTPAMRYLMKGMDEDGTAYESENIQIGDTMYARYDDEWTAMEFSGQNLVEEMSPWSQNEGWLDNDCTPKGKENIAGESCVHYVCDVQAAEMLAQAMAEGATNITNLKGEFWVSEKLQVMVKSVISWEGTEDGKKVAFTYESLITDIDKPIKIEKPEGVQEPGAGDDIPVYPNATKTMAMPGMSTYEVEAAVADVAAWYEQELPKAGYAYNADESMSPMLLSFAKDGVGLQLMLNQDGAKVSIMLMSEAQ